MRFESAQEIPAEEYRRLIRELNDKPKIIVMFHLRWCKKAILALKEGRHISTEGRETS